MCYEGGAYNSLGGGAYNRSWCYFVSQLFVVCVSVAILAQGVLAHAVVFVRKCEMV